VRVGQGLALLEREDAGDLPAALAHERGGAMKQPGPLRCRRCRPARLRGVRRLERPPSVVPAAAGRLADEVAACRVADLETVPGVGVDPLAADEEQCELGSVRAAATGRGQLELGHRRASRCQSCS
jgi:hypothetical protein